VFEASVPTPATDPALTQPTDTAFQAELELLRTRRRLLREDLGQRVITARAPGRIAEVAAVGSAVTPVTIVAQLLPEQATEIIAYLPAETASELVAVGAEVAVTAPTNLCGDQRGTLLRMGAVVEQAPGQLDTLLRRPTYGRPVYISIPRGCALGVGQTLSVEISR
jgi:multidrug resistance efflux pump